MKKTVSVVASKDHAEKSGVKVLGKYAALEEHILFFIVESNDYEKIGDFFRPVMKIGTLRVTPASVLEDVRSKFEQSITRQRAVSIPMFLFHFTILLFVLSSQLLLQVHVQTSCTHVQKRRIK